MSGSHSLKLSFRTVYTPFTQTFKGMFFLRSVLTPQDESEQHFPKCPLGNLRCTSSKGFCGRLIWEILLKKNLLLEDLLCTWAFKHPLLCKSVIYSSPLLCLPVGRIYFLSPLGASAMWLASASGIWANIMYTVSKQKLLMCLNKLGQPLCSCPLPWEECVPNKDCSFHLDLGMKRNVERKLSQARADLQIQKQKVMLGEDFRSEDKREIPIKSKSNTNRQNIKQWFREAATGRDLKVRRTEVAALKNHSFWGRIRKIHKEPCALEM